VFQKKCKRCGAYYSSEEDTCFYHSGVFKKISSHPYFVGGGAGYWSCCDKFEEDSKGCHTGIHVEDKNTTKALNLFSQLHLSSVDQIKDSLVEEEPLFNVGLVNNVELNKLYPELWNDAHVKEGDDGRAIVLDKEQQVAFMQSKKQEEYYKHLVRPTDTLPGLSFKYGVTITEIKQLNKFQNNNDLYSFSELLIPKKENIVIDMNETEEDIDLKRKQLVQRMLRNKGVTLEVAKYYLELYDYDFDKAMNDYLEDAEWENNHPMEGFRFSEEYRTKSYSSKTKRKKLSKNRGLSSSCLTVLKSKKSESKKISQQKK